VFAALMRREWANCPLFQFHARGCAANMSSVGVFKGSIREFVSKIF
jgi:hypothetical protein